MLSDENDDVDKCDERLEYGFEDLMSVENNEKFVEASKDVRLCANGNYERFLNFMVEDPDEYCLSEDMKVESECDEVGPWLAIHDEF